MLVSISSPSIDLGSDTILYPPDTLLVIDAGPGYTSYFWSTGDTTQIITLYLYQHQYLQQYSLSCYVSDAFGCQAADTMKYLFYFDGIDDQNFGAEVLLYPSPNGEASA